MQEYKIGCATVRMHGTYDKENVQAATVRFLRQIEKQKRSKKKK
jgi:hypothetical protein